MRKICWPFGAKIKCLLSVLFCLCYLSISAQLFNKNADAAKRELNETQSRLWITYFKITKAYIPEIGTYPLDDTTASELVAQTPMLLNERWL